MANEAEEQKSGNIEIFDGEEYNLDDPNDVAWLNHKKKLKAIEEESKSKLDAINEKQNQALASMAQDDTTSGEQPKTEMPNDLMECFKQFI